jgi:hypothetical protein
MDEHGFAFDIFVSENIFINRAQPLLGAKHNAIQIGDRSQFECR